MIFQSLLLGIYLWEFYERFVLIRRLPFFIWMANNKRGLHVLRQMARGTKKVVFQYTVTFTQENDVKIDVLLIFVNLCHNPIYSCRTVGIWISLVLIFLVKQLVAEEGNMAPLAERATWSHHLLFLKQYTNHQGVLIHNTGVCRYSQLMMYNWCLFSFYWLLNEKDTYISDMHWQKLDPNFRDQEMFWNIKQSEIPIHSLAN